MSSDANVLCLFNRRFEIYGFGEDETAAFIQNYFEMTQKPDLGVQMIRYFHQVAFRHLAISYRHIIS